MGPVRYRAEVVSRSCAQIPFIHTFDVQATTGTRGYSAELSQGGMESPGAEIILVNNTILIAKSC